MRTLDQLAEIAQKAVSIGNALIKTTRPQTVTEKSDRDTYTDVDVRIQHEIRTYLAEATPEIGFIGEEEGTSSQTSRSEYVWTLDPIDGTANFVHGIPLCAVQVALLRQKRAIVSAVSLPYFDTTYWAIENEGAFANGKRIQVSATASASQSVVAIGDYATGDNAARKNFTRLTLTAALAADVERIRMFGSAAHDLVWLAEGRIDAVIILSNNSWDMAPGTLIAKEAGAILIDGSGQPYNQDSQETIAMTPGVESYVRELLNQCL